LRVRNMGYAVQAAKDSRDALCYLKQHHESPT
jgi:hypothetical protein